MDYQIVTRSRLAKEAGRKRSAGQMLDENSAAYCERYKEFQEKTRNMTQLLEFVETFPKENVPPAVRAGFNTAKKSIVKEAVMYFLEYRDCFGETTEEKFEEVLKNKLIEFYPHWKEAARLYQQISGTLMPA